MTDGIRVAVTFEGNDESIAGLIERLGVHTGPMYDIPSITIDASPEVDVVGELDTDILESVEACGLAANRTREMILDLLHDAEAGEEHEDAIAEIELAELAINQACIFLSKARRKVS